jgi:hypothetical protein
VRNLALCLAGALLLSTAANAATTIDQRGTKVLVDGVAAVDGQNFLDGVFNGTADPMPFDRLNGQDSVSYFDATWTHNYGALSGFVSSATLQIGIWDIDSTADGDQVRLFRLNNLIDLTAALNTVVEANPRGNAIYAIYDLTLPSATYAQLLTGTAQFQLQLQNGFSFNTPREFNGAILDYARITINTQDTDPGPGPEPGGEVPEPATWATMLAGFGLMGAMLRRRSASSR